MSNPKLMHEGPGLTAIFSNWIGVVGISNDLSMKITYTKVSPFLNLFQFFQPVPRIFFIMRREFWHEK
ncbi:conserved domain protein [delta proteobacterium NaphS2]|nr:conserved domain protein [delta proteobacterium NaphS2]